MRLKYTFHFQPVGRTFVGVAIGDDAKKFSGMIQLNEVGHDIVALMANEITRDEIVNKILEEYDSDQETVGKYVDDIINYLILEGVLEK